MLGTAVLTGGGRFLAHGFGERYDSLIPLGGPVGEFCALMSPTMAAKLAEAVDLARAILREGGGDA